MRSLNSLDRDYTENVNFYIVGASPGQTVDVLEQDREKEGYPWPVAEIAGNGLRDLEVIAQSTKIAVDGNGVITYRDSFGQGDAQTWGQVLAGLGSTPS